jgi:hypothetical protein
MQVLTSWLSCPSLPARLQPIATSGDICAGADLLSRIAGRQHAHAVVLEAYAAKLKRRQAALLRPANSGGGDADGSDYAAALGQKLALSLAAAADDVAAVFGSVRLEGGGGGAGGAAAAAELSAGFLVWALHQTERWVPASSCAQLLVLVLVAALAGNSIYAAGIVSSRGCQLPPSLPPACLPCRSCHLLRKHALLPFAAHAGLEACARCTFAFTAHCAALEASRGLQLVPTVQRELWPVLEQVRA